jgi:class 3 adenylate cyclase
VAPTEREHVLVAVLFTDIVGSTELAAHMGDESWKRLLHKHHEIVSHLVKERGGRVVDTAGDGVFAVFDRPAAGIQCAFDAIQALRAIGVDIRAGLHFGESESSEGKVSGIVVHTASRVMALAGAGEILITGTVRDLIAGKRISVGDRGAHDLKGIPTTWNVFSVEEIDGKRTPPPMEPNEAEALRDQTVTSGRQARSRSFVVGAIAGLLVLSGVAAYVLQGEEGDPHGGPPRPTSLVHIDLETQRRSQMSVGDTVTALALGEGSVWLASYGDSSVYRVDPGEMTVEARIRLPEPPQEIATGAGSVWVTTSRELIQIDATSAAIEREFSLGGCDPFGDEEGCQTDVTVMDGTVWATHKSNRRLVEIDPASGAVSRIRVGGDPMAVSAGHGALWVFVDTASSPIIERRNLETGDVSTEALPIGIIDPVCSGYGKVASPGELCVAIGIGENSVWVATPEELTSDLWPLDPRTGDLRGVPKTLPCCVMAIAPGGGFASTIWTGLSDGKLILVTEASVQPEERGSVRGVVTDVAVGYGGLWVSVDAQGPDAD